MNIPKKVQEKMVDGLKRLLPIVQQQKARDVSEADTVTLVKDLLSEAFGYDKYAELTSEHAVRGTYCDLAVKIDGKLLMLIEVKSAGTNLDDRHVKQVVDYASNQGVEWVLLTNGSVWRLYQVIFAKPIDKRLLCEVDLTTIDLRKAECLECIYLLTRDGFLKGAHLELRAQQDATSRYLLASLLVNNESVVAVIRRELRRIVDVLVDDDNIINVLRHEVVKRDTLEGPDYEAATKKVNKAEDKRAKSKVVSDTSADGQPEIGVPVNPVEERPSQVESA